jgi:hypothetical protein
MRPFVKITFIAAGVSTVVLGSSAFAYAGWTTSSPSTVLNVSAASVPDGPRPTAVAHGQEVDLSWVRTNVSARVPAQRYLIRRHGAAGPIIVCTASAPGCRDTQVPPGQWTYTVRLMLQTWEGSDGPPSLPVTVGGTADAGVAPGGSVIGPEPTETGAEAADQELGSPSGTLTGSTGAVASQ